MSPSGARLEILHIITQETQGAEESMLYLNMDDCRVLLRGGSVVPGGYFDSVIRFSVVGKKLRGSDVSSFTVNLKVSKLIIL